VSAAATFCQAYSDAEGTKELGSPFFLDHDVTFSSSPVPIGSFRCADRLAKLLQSPPSSSSTSSPPPAATGGQPGEQSVTIHFRTDFMEFVQGDVPFNQLYKLGKSFSSRRF
jgi:hypothetical protein